MEISWWFTYDVTDPELTGNPSPKQT